MIPKGWMGIMRMISPASPAVGGACLLACMTKPDDFMDCLATSSATDFTRSLRDGCGCFRALAVLVVALLPVVNAHGQVDALRTGGQTPTAASLGKFGEHPVSLYTGAPSISVPLFDVEGYTLSLPVTLNYHASGVKVEEVAGWVGAGWALNAGGVITRTTRGLPDDAGFGYMSTAHRLTDEIWGEARDGLSVRLDEDTCLGSSPPSECLQSQELSTYLTDLEGSTVDPEPDQYYFNFAGSSGQFIIDAQANTTGNLSVIAEAYPVSHREVAIRHGIRTSFSPPMLMSQSQITATRSWTITAEDGTRYVFGSETSFNGLEFTYGSDTAWISAWYLTAIHAPSGDDVITFTYDSPNTLLVRDHKDHVSGEARVGTTGQPSQAQSQTPATRTRATHLSQITSAKTTITFHSTPRGSIYQQADEHRLNRIERRSPGLNGTLLQAYEMDYTMMWDRLFLNEVQAVNADGSTSFEPYRFTYETLGGVSLPGKALPDRLSNDYDHWGYYNNARNSGEQLPKVHATIDNQITYVDGADREPHPDYVKLGVLTQITYPTGGYSRFEYEANRYGVIARPFNEASPRPLVKSIPPQRVSQDAVAAVLDNDGLLTTVTPVTIDGNQPVTVRFEVTMSPGGPYADSEAGLMQCQSEQGTYCAYVQLLTNTEAQVFDESGAPVVFYWPAGDHVIPGTGSLGVTFEAFRAIAPGSYQLKAGIADRDGALAQAKATWDKFVAVPDLIGGGLRIRQMRSHDGLDAANDVVRTYVYELPNGEGSGVLMREPNYYYVFDGENLGKFLKLTAHPVGGLGSTQGSPIGYRRVTVLNGADSTQGWTVHEFATAIKEHHADIALAEEDQVWPFGMASNRDFKRGWESRTTVYRADGHPLRQTTRERISTDTPNTPDFGLTRYVRALTYTRTPQQYFKPYNAISAWQYNVSESTRLYDEADTTSVLETTTTYAYNNALQVKQMTVESGGLKRTTAYEYAHEYVPGMASRNMLTQPFSTTIKDGALNALTKSWTCWGSGLTSGWVPTAQWEWASGNTIPSTDSPCFNATLRDDESRLLTQFNSYDTRGRVTRQTDARGQHTEFIYTSNSSDPLCSSGQGVDDLFLTCARSGNLSLQYAYHTGGHQWGLVEKVFDENQRATIYSYDTSRRLSSVTGPSGQQADFSYATNTVPNSVTTTTDFGAGQQGVSTAFVDGLGRDIQTRVRTEANTYIVSAMQYDKWGRPWKTWRPYYGSGTAFEGYVTVNGAAQNEYSVSSPYVTTTYYGDPLARVASVLPEHDAINLDEQYRPVESAYGVHVPCLGPTTPGGSCSNPSPFAYTMNHTDVYAVVGSSSVQRTLVFTDGFGREDRRVAASGTPEETITRMVYDDLDNLVEVQPPNYFTAPPGQESDWVTTYAYNRLQQLVRKSTPDAEGDWEYQYDANGNLRFVLDPNRRGEGGGFLYTKYDDYNRVTETGLYTGPISFGQAALQVGNASFPTTDVVPTVTYRYDDYQVDRLSSLPVMPPVERYPKGRLTELTFNGGYYQYFHDAAGRIAYQAVSLDGLGIKVITYEYDLADNVTNVRYQPGKHDEMNFWYEYDDASRLRAVYSNVEDNRASALQEATYTYNAAGQPGRVELGTLSSGNTVQQVDYEYNARGWLTAINDPRQLAADAFGLRLRYQTPEFNVQGYENGNIAEAEWRTAGATTPDNAPGYAYTYDNLNRLTKAEYRHRVATSWTEDMQERYDVPSITYDPNGNIKNLSRNDDRGEQSAYTYIYDGPSKSNRLLGLTKGGVTKSYTYDWNGNVTRDRADNLYTAYDTRNLPTEVTLGGSGHALQHRYDAGGLRVYKEIGAGGASPASKTYYVRGLNGEVLAVYSFANGSVSVHWNILAGGTVIGRIEEASP
ncbi:MAG: DUF6443 domain-containing protein [Bacteroidota bacterium]